MGKGNSKLFDGAFDAKSTEEPEERGRRSGYLESRTNELSRVAAGDVAHKTLLSVDPKRCRMWEAHNRRYELLNETRCADLIEGIKAQQGQEFPAVVRKLRDDPDYDYEVICGARRHWTISWLREQHFEYKFLIEVRDLTDEQAFRLSDVENRDREDISDYERAIDYAHALKKFYRTQKEMAERLEVSVAWLSRYLDIAELPDEIIAAYPDITEVRVQHARELKPLLKEAKLRNRVLKEANELAREQAEARENGDPLIDGTKVVKRLRAAARPPKKSSNGVLACYESKAKKRMLEVSRRGNSGLLLRVLPESGASQSELLTACERAFNEYLKR